MRRQNLLHHSPAKQIKFISEACCCFGLTLTLPHQMWMDWNLMTTLVVLQQNYCGEDSQYAYLLV